MVCHLSCGADTADRAGHYCGKDRLHLGVHECAACCRTWTNVYGELVERLQHYKEFRLFSPDYEWPTLFD